MKFGSSVNNCLQILYQKHLHSALVALKPPSSHVLAVTVVGVAQMGLKALQRGCGVMVLGQGQKAVGGGTGQGPDLTELWPFPIPGPVEAVQFISEGEAISLQLPPTQPELELPSAVAVSPASKGQLVRSVLESQPLVRSSGCSDRLATALAPSDLRPGQRGVAEALAPLSSCASEMQHKWPHAPVECTELDLQKFSSQVEFVGSERSEEVGSQATRGVPREGSSAALEAGSSLVVDPARGLSPTVQNPTAESGEQPVSSSSSPL